ncbi:MAG: hypothetical protein OXN17_01845 [Candidatus Poribacteria bacterium]|nr:hypothetical protein [Candidatus Poribacteria bacterium]MDE0506125.1 hypothetical protein [Candidatus Poribacteria bacterium]
MQRLYLLLMVSLMLLSDHELLRSQTADSQDAPEPEEARTKDEQLRQIQIDKAKLKMELAKKLMEKKEDELNNLKTMLREANNIVTVQEVNRAEEEYERDKANYEEAKLDLQNTELDSLKAAWRITILDTRRYEARDGREMFSITLKNSSLPVKLEESSRVLERDVVISAQIDDILVSIKDQGDFGRDGAIVATPYEVRIPSLKEGEEKTLEFELAKDEVQDVVVSLEYLGLYDDRNIHLKQEEPYISVLSARRYKEGDRRRLEIVLKYGAILDSSAPQANQHIDDGGLPTAQDDVAQEINNVYVSIKDEKEAIIGVPYEIRIPNLKDQQSKTLDFELRRNVDSIVVSLRYLEKNYPYKIHLEEDTRHISIISAKKYRQNNQIMVAVRLKNTSTTESMPVNASPEEIAAANEIRSIFVSLKDIDSTGGVQSTNIAQPYERKIPLLGYNDEIELTFQLQKDVDSIMIALKYPDLLETDNRLVYLQKESEEDVVNVSSLQFSQEGNLGSSVTYDLTLDRLAETENTFQLRIINLLKRFTFEFQDTESKSRVSQVKFTQAQSKRDLSLTIHVTEELDASYLDSTLELYVAVIDADEAQQLGGVNNRLELSPDQISRIKGGIERFELIPKGVPEIELFIPSSYHTIKIGEQIDMTAILRNIGTRDLADIRMEVDVYTDWDYIVQPEVVAGLVRNEETEVNLTIIPPPNVGVGEYEAKVNAKLTVDNRYVEAREKTVRVLIQSQPRLSVTTILFGVLVLLVIGIVIVTVRISRR